MSCKKIILLILTAIVVFSFVACGNGDDKPKFDPNDPLTGEWSEDKADGFGLTFIFNGDGTGEQRTLDIVTEFTYTYNEDTVFMDLYVDNPPIKKENKYKIEGNTLVLQRDNGEGGYVTTTLIKR